MRIKKKNRKKNFFIEKIGRAEGGVNRPRRKRRMKMEAEPEADGWKHPGSFEILVKKRTLPNFDVVPISKIWFKNLG